MLSPLKASSCLLYLARNSLMDRQKRATDRPTLPRVLVHLKFLKMGRYRP